MADERTTPGTVDDYLAAFDGPIRERLDAMRATIRAAAPEATETMSYQMPTFHQHENLVHFAGFAHHTGFYPGASGVAAFEAELSGYVHARGSIRLPHDRPLPLELVRRITEHRVREATERHAAKPRRRR